MKSFVSGIFLGFSVAVACTANAGIVSHVVAYEVGKSSGKAEAKSECKCPDKGKE